MYAVLFPYEIEKVCVLEKRMPGHWIEVGKVDDVTKWRREFDTAFLVFEGLSTEVGYIVEGPAELKVNPENGNIVGVVYGSPNWWLLENNGVDYWRWSKGDASVTIHNPQMFVILADVSFGLATVDLRTVIITANGKVVWNGKVIPAFDNRATIAGVELPPGDTELLFHNNRPAVYLASSDPRLFSFSIRNLKIDLKRNR